MKIFVDPGVKDDIVKLIAESYGSTPTRSELLMFARRYRLEPMIGDSGKKIYNTLRQWLYRDKSRYTFIEALKFMVDSNQTPKKTNQGIRITDVIDKFNAYNRYESKPTQTYPKNLKWVIITGDIVDFVKDYRNCQKNIEAIEQRIKDNNDLLISESKKLQDLKNQLIESQLKVSNGDRVVAEWSVLHLLCIL